VAARVASVSITTRKTKGGPRYAVRYRLGGRAYPIQHGGSFPTLKEARARRDLIAGELAAGRNPADLLRTSSLDVQTRDSSSAWADRFVASRIDVDANTIRNYRTALKRVSAAFGDRDPATVTVD